MGTHPLPKKGTKPPSKFSAHVYCGQTAWWVKMALGMEVGLGPGHIVLDGNPAPLPQNEAGPPIFGPFLLWPNFCMPFGIEVGVSPGDCVRWGPSSLHKKGRSPPPQFAAHAFCGQMAAWIKMPLGTEVGLGLRDIVLDGKPAPLP